MIAHPTRNQPKKGITTVNNYSDGYPKFTVSNPLAVTVREGEEIITQLQTVAADLDYAIQRERELHSVYRDALDNYELSETDQLADVVIMAQAKEGPLGGLATTSKAYDIALSKVKNDLRRGPLVRLWEDAERHRHNYDAAQSHLQAIEARFNALRKIADLKANILRASTI